MSTPARRIERHTPANDGSPPPPRVVVTWSTSPGFAASGFFFENSAVRAPVGSSRRICCAWYETRGDGCVARIDGGGVYTAKAVRMGLAGLFFVFMASVDPR